MIKRTVSVGGLGGNPYRDGSYAYYLSERVVTDDPKGVGAFLLATCEMEIATKWHRLWSVNGSSQRKTSQTEVD